MLYKKIVTSTAVHTSNENKSNGCCCIIKHIANGGIRILQTILVNVAYSWLIQQHGLVVV